MGFSFTSKIRLWTAAILVLFCFAATAENLPSSRRTLSDDFRSRFGPTKIAFVDADGTLRVTKSGSPWVLSADDVFILPGVADRIAQLRREGFLIALVSNQSQDLSFEEKDAAMQLTLRLIEQQNPEAIINYYDFAEAFGGMRKPNIGMAQKLIESLKSAGYIVDLSNSVMIGDSLFALKEGGDSWSNYDRLFAERLGIPFIHPQQAFGWTDEIRRWVNTQRPDRVANLQKLAECFSPVSIPAHNPSGGTAAPLPPLSGFEQTVGWLSMSSKVHFVEGTTAIPVGFADFIPNESYTVNVLSRRGHLAIGHGIIGADRRIGGSLSHIALGRLTFMPEDLEDIVSGLGGAIRINADGSIDVSGYHSLAPSKRAAQKIERLLRFIVPFAKIRSTPDRLSEFDYSVAARALRTVLPKQLKKSSKKCGTLSAIPKKSE